MNLKVYVAAPFVDRDQVREIHRKFETLGIEWTSNWANEPGDGPEDLSQIPHDELLSLAARNDHDVTRAHAVLMLCRPGVGGEQFAEARLAHDQGKPIVWVGRQTLSTFRPNTVRAANVEEGIRELLLIAREGTQTTQGSCGDRPRTDRPGGLAQSSEQDPRSAAGPHRGKEQCRCAPLSRHQDSRQHHPSADQHQQGSPRRTHGGALGIDDGR